MITFRKITSFPDSDQKKLEKKCVSDYLKEKQIPKRAKNQEKYHAYYEWNVIWNCPMTDPYGSPVIRVLSDNDIFEMLNQPGNYLLIDSANA